MNLRRPPANADSTSGNAIYAVRAPYNYSLCLDAGGKMGLSGQTPISVYAAALTIQAFTPLSWPADHRVFPACHLELRAAELDPQV